MNKPHAIVTLPDGREHHFANLLGDGKSNAKTLKNGTTTLYLSMWPDRVPGHPEYGSVCANSTPGCRSLCDVISGRAIGHSEVGAAVLRGPLARRILFATDRVRFLAMWHHEIKAGITRAHKKGQRLAVRANAFSDLDWVRLHPEMIRDYNNVQFYDYTKDPKRYRRFLHRSHGWPAQYHLTFSQSEKNEAECREFLALGGTVAAVFNVKYDASRGTKHPLPAEHLGHHVIDGDLHDRRYEDPAGVVVGLRAKGRARGKAHQPGGFVILA